MTSVFRRHRSTAATLGILLPALAAAEVNVRLSETNLSQERPLQVTFEASGSSVSLPDLTPLQADFEIVNRNVQQRSSTVNGRRTQSTTLTLVLRPKRSGKLEIPALRFGGESSTPQAISVSPAALATAPGPAQTQVSAPWDSQSPWDRFGTQPAPSGQPFPGDGFDSPFPPLAGAPSPGWPGLAASPPASDKGGAPGSPSRDLAIGAGGPLDPSAPAEADRYSSWSWIAGIAAAGWLGTLFLCWLRRRQRLLQAAAHPISPPIGIPASQPEQETPQARAIQAVATAYLRGDAGSAREALLVWARLTWTADPPGNLSRLAERLAEPLRGHVLELDEALYSPAPVPWEERPVAELLGSLRVTPGKA